ncbi:MAG: four helix bundle protein [Candidatus Omnitrophica bacterium]|nr:four helix bundle protein [Candidatus Omnitrophota bacterium]
MKINSFEDLIVWQKSHLLVLSIYKITRSFPNEKNFCLTSQIRRSAISICANIAEGYKKSRKDFLRFLDISQGSLEETKYHLILSRDLSYCDQRQFNQLSDMANEISKMLTGLKRSLFQLK